MFGKKTFLMIIISIAVYTIYILASDIPKLYDEFSNFDTIILFPALALIFFAYVIRGVRYKLLLNEINIDMSMKQSMMLFFTGLSLGMTPGKFGEVIKSTYLKKLYNHPISKTAPVVFIERYYDLVGIVAIALISIWTVDVDKTFLIVASALMFIFLIIGKQEKLVTWILVQFKSISFFKKISEKLLEMYNIIHDLLNVKIYAKSFLLSVVAWMVESYGVYLIFQGFGIDLSFLLVITIFIVSSIIGALSFLPGGIGVTEIGMTGLLILNGVEQTQAIGVTLLTRLSTLWYSVILGLIAMRFMFKNPTLE